jgi:hypothetical protein
MRRESAEQERDNSSTDSSFDAPANGARRRIPERLE